VIIFQNTLSKLRNKVLNTFSISYKVIWMAGGRKDECGCKKNRSRYELVSE
jgi:hypothetical protein